jgi:hypothetical protein
MVWIGDEEITVEELIQRVLNDIEWLDDLRQNIQRELECKQELLAWLDNARYLGHTPLVAYIDGRHCTDRWATILQGCQSSLACILCSSQNGFELTQRVDTGGQFGMATDDERGSRCPDT